MTRIDLTGTWTLQRDDSSKMIPAMVPGDTHSALLAAGEISDPYWGKNELELQDLGNQDWSFTRTIEVTAELLEEDSIFLNFDVLDTVAEVSVNGKRVGDSANMFVRQRFEIKKQLVLGSNEIMVTLKSPVKAAKALIDKMPYAIPTGSAPVASPHRNMLRKVQCHSGWDWGVCLMVSGIYGNTWLGATSAGRIESVVTTQAHCDEACKVTIECEVLAVNDLETELQVTCGTATTSKRVALTKGLNLIETTVTIDAPKLWWPNGHGDQPLYDLTVSVAGDEVRKRIGLRTIELVNDEDDIGLSMYFKVNGRPIFCKGADWIPCDALPARQTHDVYDDLLSSAVDANMNMLRVWGGGQYENDAFYELCDEKGLLIWQDFMFACSLYPATPEFLANVREEAEYQIKRLRDHACLALWCGNNENIAALKWYQESRDNRDRYLVDYDRLNEGVLGNAVDKLDPTRTFWPSSPSGGRGDYSDCFHDDSRGDMHYWEVWHGGKSMDSFYSVIPRFCSEFGYQSFPSAETIRSYAPDNQLNVTSPVLEHHQRNTGGNSKIIEMFSRYFRMPEGFGNFVYLSQVLQGLAIKTAVEHWRHLQPTCMGTVYWQLNDNWPVCSWASIEYGGKWKLLHYMAKRFFEPTIASAFQHADGTLELWVTNDEARERHCKVTARVFDFAGKILKEKVYDVTAPAGGAKCLEKQDTGTWVEQRDAAFMHLTLEVDGEVFQNEHFFTTYKQCELPEARIETSAKQEGDNIAVTLTANAPAFYVSLEHEGIRGVFDDNCITLLPGQPRTLVFKPKGKVTATTLAEALTVNHLRGTYQ